MRITPTKLLNAFTAVVLIVLLWMVFKQSTPKWEDEEEFTATCHLSARHLESLHRLVYAAHKLLDALNLSHFLCYGSLFGQIRKASSLPWERDAEMCVLNSEFSKYDEVLLQKAFRGAGMSLEYDSGEGRYHVQNITLKEDALLEGLLLQLFVFASDKGIVVNGDAMLHRVGWKRRMLPPDCDYSSNLDCFPARLAEMPLPLKLFGWQAVPVPREEFEILKYHFPNNWWREEKPLNC